MSQVNVGIETKTTQTEQPHPLYLAADRREPFSPDGTEPRTLADCGAPQPQESRSPPKQRAKDLSLDNPAPDGPDPEPAVLGSGL